MLDQCHFLFSRGAFMFLKPSLSEVSIIYELPFSTSVWACYILTVAFLTVVLAFVQRVERHVRPLSSPDHPILWSDAVLDTVGIVCQQGEQSNNLYYSAETVSVAASTQ
jgi:hypothetical protein